MAAFIAERIDRLAARVDAGDLQRRHRLGAWESAASFRARAALNAAENAAEYKGASPSSEVREIMSENG
jgi:hypothetical protein